MSSWLLHNSFLLMALCAGLIASITTGVVSSFIVIKRIVFLSGSISHAVLGGIGCVLWLEKKYGFGLISPMQGALCAGLLASIAIGVIHLRYKEREDTLIAALWALGMSSGVIFISLTPGYSVELMRYLFGNILWVTQSDLVTLAILDGIVLATFLLFRHQLLAICFDERQALLQKISPTRFYLILLSLISVSVVLLIQIIGAILVVAMLAIPGAIACQISHRFSAIVLWSILLSAAFICIGVIASYLLNWPSGATISCFASLAYLLVFVVKEMTVRRRV